MKLKGQEEGERSQSEKQLMKRERNGQEGGCEAREQ